MQAKKSTENSWKIRDSERKMKVNLVKESDNEADKEAIKVELPGFGIVGYVANSPYTTMGESYSAGRIYDRIGDTAISPEDGTYYTHIPLYS